MYKEYLFPPSPAMAGQGRYKEMEAPPLPPLPATQLDIPPNHTIFDFSQRRCNKLNLLYRQSAEPTALAPTVIV